MRTKDADAGTVLILVMLTILFTSFALIAFIDKASNDLLVEARVAQSDRLRMDAYSALDVTLAVLDDFIRADNGLRAPAEGWSDPLNWAAWTPSPGHTVDVSLSDESAKIPLNHVTAQVMLNLFEAWQMNQDDAQKLTDAILSWMQQNYVPTTPVESDYEQSAIPYDPPLRAMRSLSELAAIDVARDMFFDQNGRPNSLWWRFANDFSIFNYPAPNINGANPDVMTAVGEFTDQQQQAISDYQNGTGQYANQGPNWFQNGAALKGVVGTLAGNPGSFGTAIRALRILITVHEGNTVYRLSVVVAPKGGARSVETTATEVKANTSNSTSGESSATPTVTSPANQSQPTNTPTSAQTAAAASQNLQYPFTILEIRENDDIPVPPPPPPTPPS
jgi:hypothetical protein